MLSFSEYSSCGRFDLTLDAKVFHIKSPNYPSDYPHNSYCVWKITAPKGMTIDVRFQDIIMEECCDSVEVGAIGIKH